MVPLNGADVDANTREKAVDPIPLPAVPVSFQKLTVYGAATVSLFTSRMLDLQPMPSATWEIVWVFTVGCDPKSKLTAMFTEALVAPVEETVTIPV
jgi:hypothetical protein